MKDIVDVNTALLELDQFGLDSYFLDIMHTNSFEVGILRLKPGQKDTQGPHSADELYFVVLKTIHEKHGGGQRDKLKLIG